MKNIIIFDLDGTLALIDHRRHLVEKKLAFTIWWENLPADDPAKLLEQFDPGKNGFAALIDHFVTTTNWKANWDEFYEGCGKDLPNHPVIEIYNALNNSHIETDWDIYIFSGRSEVVRHKTNEWLENNEVYISSLRLFMRPDKDYTPDEELKKKWLMEIGGPDKVFCCFDDRQKVVDMWRSMGITCFQVAPGNF